MSVSKTSRCKALLATLSRDFFAENVAVGVVLDKTRGRARPSHPGSHLAAHPLHAARQEPSLFTARFIPEGRRRLHVGLHGVRVHGADGVLSGEHRSRRLGYARSEASTSAAAAVLEHRGLG